VRYLSKTLTASLAVLILNHPTAGIAAKKNPGHSVTAETTAEGTPVLWRDPGDIASRDLYYGAGGKAHEPHGTFTFEKEDMQGSNPKFEVVDQDGIKWKVKMGDEARPETVAARLVWAVGYFANEDYFMPVLHVQNMPHLHRGGNLVSPDGTVHNVRLKRHLKDEKKIGAWSWEKNPFTGTPEWYGLRVLMAVINNWDLKDSNNSIYQVRGDHPEQRYVVTDLGSSFGSPGLNWAAKGNLHAYTRSKLIGKTSAEFVDFNVPAAPKMNTFIDVPELTRRLGLCWIGHHIPVADVQSIGHLLAQLSPDQIRDAFRAGGYSPEEVEAYSEVLERRIAQLGKLKL
jgi:hypothetical protein